LYDSGIAVAQSPCHPERRLLPRRTYAILLSHH
jgi:hypothetical protein